MARLGMPRDPKATSSLAVFVIGVDGALRSPSLVEALGQSPFDVHVVEPFWVQPSHWSELTDDVAATLLFGRPLTQGEVGCWFAHRKVYEAASAMGCSWAIVLEDDAGIPARLWDHVSEIIRSLDADEPSIVSLFAQDHPGRSGKGTREEAVIPMSYAPTNTVAYAINRTAMETALASPPRAISTADWPPWSVSVKFYLLANSPVIHEADSVIGTRPDSSSGLRSVRRLAAVLSPKAWSAGQAYFADRRTYLVWAVLIPARKAARRAWTGLAHR